MSDIKIHKMTHFLRRVAACSVPDWFSCEKDLRRAEVLAEHHSSSLLQRRTLVGRPLSPSKLAHWANIAHGQRAPQDASRVGRTSTRALTLVGTMARSNGTIY